MAASSPPARDALARVLAAPREAGTPEAAAARAAVAAHLEALGFEVSLEPIRFDPSPLWTFPILGAGLAALGVALLPLLIVADAPAWGAAAVWASATAGLAACAARVGTGRARLRFAGAARQDANLVATRGTPPRRWIVAHLDTKAQGHSMAGRLVAVWSLLAAAAVLAALAGARLAGRVDPGAAAAAAALALAAGALAARGRPRGRTVGARDNASGVLAALEAAAALAADGGPSATGIVITGAEELGLVGARAFAAARGTELRGCEIVNLDTLDDTGVLAVVSHDGGGAALAERVAAALGVLGIPVRSRRLPLGILVDSLPLARAGAQAVTVARLDWSTLRRLHTARDTADGLAFATAERVGRALGRSFDLSPTLR